ncbi:Slam-dependent surface lipoprotein [Marinimicrobium sp. ARAG 43.8]|uniref:Slam-dependent surface lipoprotein n=1 Tax=Marinimicrobium sp. ARAG 43.8 TaxID=3418719 RepID=UPI003CF7CF6E
MKTFTFASAALMSLALSAVAHADYLGGQSSSADIEVGESTVDGGPHSSGQAGIGIDNGTLSTADKIDFSGILLYSDNNFDTDHHDVYLFNGGPTDHGGMGVFTFAEVGVSDVWYGEWSNDGNAGGFTDRAVYYVGDKGNVDSTMPTTGSATYTVQGISQFNESASSPNTLAGYIDVYYGGGPGSVSGELENDTLGISIDAAISGSSFSGNAEAYNVDTESTLATGASQGEFYGSGAAALAGMATFSGADSQYNTAFGGAK